MNDLDDGYMKVESGGDTLRRRVEVTAVVLDLHGQQVARVVRPELRDGEVLIDRIERLPQIIRLQK